MGPFQTHLCDNNGSNVIGYNYERLRTDQSRKTVNLSGANMFSFSSVREQMSQQTPLISRAALAKRILRGDGNVPYLG